MAVEVGDVFNYPGTRSEPTYRYNENSWHIHIVVKIDESRGDAYLVSLSTSDHWDSTCEINVKDGCPLVTKRCFVSYFDSKKVSLNSMQKVAVFGGPAPTALLAKVTAGVKTSRRSPQWFKDAIFPPAPRSGKILPSG
jgi:hypothetical protein